MRKGPSAVGGGGGGRTWGFLQMRAPDLFCKTLSFLKIMVWSHEQGEGGGVKAVRTIADKETIFFAILCGRFLWTFPKRI